MVAENFIEWIGLYNKVLIKQLFVPYGKYLDLIFLYEPHFIRTVRQNCGPNNLPYVTSQLIGKSIILEVQKLDGLNYI